MHLRDQKKKGRKKDRRRKTPNAKKIETKILKQKISNATYFEKKWRKCKHVVIYINQM